MYKQLLLVPSQLFQGLHHIGRSIPGDQLGADKTDNNKQQQEEELLVSSFGPIPTNSVPVIRDSVLVFIFHFNQILEGNTGSSLSMNI